MMRSAADLDEPLEEQQCGVLLEDLVEVCADDAARNHLLLTPQHNLIYDPLLRGELSIRRKCPYAYSN